ERHGCDRPRCLDESSDRRVPHRVSGLAACLEIPAKAWGWYYRTPPYESLPQQNHHPGRMEKVAYDLIVIGSGPGGYSAAVRAGQYGLRTAIIEKDPKLGGTCLHVGCIPTKALLHTADVWEHFLHPEADGIECQNPRLNYPKVIERKNGIVAKHAKGVEFLMKKNKVEWIKGRATLKGAGKIDVAGQIVETKNIIIATGS